MLRRLPFALLILAFLAAMVWAVYTFVTRDHPGANDFYQRWYCSRAFWVEGRDPYDPKVSLEVEMVLYGHPWSPDPALDEFPGDFLYPFPTAIVLAPLTPLSYAWASAIWIVVTWAFVAAAFVALVDLFRWRAPTWLLAFGVAWTAFFYPATRGMFLGQMGTVVACLELLTVWALVKGYDAPAGVLLAISTFKPQIGFLIIPFLLLWSLRFRRWRFVVSFGWAALVILGLSFALLPTWLTEWLAQTASYAGYTRTGSPVSIVTTDLLPFLGRPGELGINAALVILLLWAWVHALWKREAAWFVWTAALSLTVTHLIAIRTATPHFVVFLIVLVFCFREIMRLRIGSGRALATVGAIMVAATMIALGIGLWVLFLATLENRFESPLNYLPLPFGCLIILCLTRRRWWAERT
ncbi:MAG TPA: glycosyltransferase family 87 protein [Aggregatilineales bacterium]|nr:glycosyltransferase family 87 protein [Aggregatilineales bacterium]